MCYVCGVRTFLAMIQLIECTTRERDSAHFRQSLLLLTLRGCDTRLSSFAACSLALVALRLSVRPFGRLFLSLSLSLSLSDPSFDFGRRRRDRRPFVAHCRRRTPPHALPRPGSPLPLCQVSRGGEEGKGAGDLSPSECPQADFAIGEPPRDRERVSSRCSLKKPMAHFIIGPN